MPCEETIAPSCDELGGGSGLGLVDGALLRRAHKASTSMVAVSDPVLLFFLGPLSPY